MMESNANGTEPSHALPPYFLRLTDHVPIQKGDDDRPQLPREWSSGKKSAIVALVSSLNFLVNFSATMPSPGISDIMTDTGTKSRILATFSVSVYILGIAFGPLILAPLSEMYGRLPIYTFTNILFIYFTALCSVASELPVLVVLRFLDGCMGSVPIVIGGGTIADIYPPETRGRAMSVYMLSAMMGPPIGPIVGAVITQKLGWRWIFGTAAIASAILSIVCFFYLEETHEETVLRRHRNRKLERKRQRLCGLSWPRFKFAGSEKLTNSLRQPFKLLFTDSAVLLLGIYQAFAYGYMLFMLTSFSNVFVGQYGFSTSTSGLPYLGIAVGFGVGVLIISAFGDRIATTLTLRNKGVRVPAFRLPLMAWSCWIPPLALAAYGWSAFYKVHFMVPIASVALYSIALQLIMVNVQVYLSEAHKTRVASAIAAVTVLRCLLGAVLPLVGVIMYEKLGLGWGNTLLAFMAFAMMPLPWAIMRSGQRAQKAKRSDENGIVESYEPDNKECLLSR